jgi:hypothetical protein
MLRTVSLCILMAAGLAVQAAGPAPEQAKPPAQAASKADTTTQTDTTLLLRPEIPTDVSAYMVPTSQLLTVDDFRAAYFKAIGPMKRVDWLRQLPGDEYAQSLDFEGRRYVLVRSCSPRDCKRHYITLLYDPKTRSVSGLVQDGLRRTFIGRRDHPARNYFPKEVKR